MYAVIFIRIKGSEEQLAEVTTLMDKCGDDFEKFNLEVAKLAFENDPDNYEDQDPKDQVVPCYYQNTYELEKGGDLEFDLGTDDGDFTPDEACAFGYLLENAFPGIEANWLYRCDEWSSDRAPHGLFARGGDSAGNIWSGNYVLELPEEDDCWYDDLDELIENIEEITGRDDLESFADCMEAMEEYDEENGGDGFILSEVDEP